MLEILQSSTLVTGYGLVASPFVSTTTNVVKLEKDSDGNIEAIGIKPMGAIIPTTVAVGTTAISLGQELHFQNTLDKIKQENVVNAQAVIESLSEEQLLNLEKMLQEKEQEFSVKSNIEEKATVKTYTIGK